MEYSVELPRELKINADEFVHVWNREEARAKLATARTVEGEKERYDGGVFTVPVILGTVAVHIAATAIYDGLRGLFAEKGVKEQTDFELVEHPDGTRLIRVRITRTK